MQTHAAPAVARFPGRSGAYAGAARRWVSRHTAQRVDHHDIVTVVGELVANAITHSRSEVVTVELWVGHGLELVVTDEGGPTQPRRRDDILATRGRGLAIVDALASAWGVNGDEHGRSVWAWFPPQER